MESAGCLGASGVAGADSDEAAIGVLVGQVGHPERPDVLGLPEGEVEVRLGMAK
jgi:hypothetical protein